MKLKNVLGALLVVLSTPLSAQTLLGGAEFGHKFGFGLNVGAGVEYRSADWFKNNDQWNAEVSVSYKPVKPLKIGAAYKFIQAQTLATQTSNYDIPAYYVNKHRISVDVAGEWKPLKALTLSFRERYQYTYRPKIQVPRFDLEDYNPAGNKTVAAKSKHILRSRIMAEVNPSKKCRFTPFWSFELYSLLADYNHTKSIAGNAHFCDKWRVAAGTAIKIDRHNSFDVFYRFAKTTDEDEMDSPHTIGIVYSFKL